MRKTIVALFFLFIFLSSAGVARADILVIDRNGNRIWNVLSSQDQIALSVAQKSQLDVKDVAKTASSDNDKTILLKKENDKVVMNVGDNQKFDLTNYKSDVVQIEERGDAKKITISVVEGKFVIAQTDVLAHTNFPISISEKENQLSLMTDSGATSLAVLPLEAAETALRSKLISKVIDKNMNIEEKDLGVLAYEVRGQKDINLFNLVNINIPVSAYVSTTTGEILSVDQPKWLSMLGFLFT